jgi:hypothetical protein
MEALLKNHNWLNYYETLIKAGIIELSDISCKDPNYLILSLGIPPLIAKSLINLSKLQNSKDTTLHTLGSQTATNQSSSQSSNSDQIPPEIIEVLSIDIYSPCGLSPSSSEEEIKKKWKELMPKVHPDKNSAIDIQTSQDYNKYFNIKKSPSQITIR